MLGICVVISAISPNEFCMFFLRERFLFENKNRMINFNSVVLLVLFRLLLVPVCLPVF